MAARCLTFRPSRRRFAAQLNSGVRYFNPYGDSFQMPCNAHGHPPFCECGWGGVNYDPWKPKLKVNWSQATSHTIPNASCPVCSAKVFFYRSPDGGAVFFDDLGPPWPKHPCTSNGAHRLTEKIFEERNKKRKTRGRKIALGGPTHAVNPNLCLMAKEPVFMA